MKGPLWFEKCPLVGRVAFVGRAAFDLGEGCALLFREAPYSSAKRPPRSASQTNFRMEEFPHTEFTTAKKKRGRGQLEARARQPQFNGPQWSFGGPKYGSTGPFIIEKSATNCNKYKKSNPFWNLPKWELWFFLYFICMENEILRRMDLSKLKMDMKTLIS